jgi:hypothetical protein
MPDKHEIKIACISFCRSPVAAAWSMFCELWAANQERLPGWVLP